MTGSPTPQAPSLAPRARARRSGVPVWWSLALLLALGSILVRPTDRGQHDVLEWQPALALAEPWRWWSAAWVHYSELHLLANLAGLLLVAALGWAGGVNRLSAIAWGLAWPLTHLGLLLQPALSHYGGLSGVLHAGVAVVAVALWREGPQARRRVGQALVAGLILKLLLETPWAGPLRRPPGWDIDIAPFAHLTGAIAGTLCVWVLRPWSGRRPPAPADPAPPPTP